MKKNVCAFLLCFILLVSMGHSRYTQNSPKIDQQPVDGLLGVEGSLAYKVEEIKKHLHNQEDWFGLAAVPNAEVHRADDVTDGTIAPFQIDAGNDTWGAWVQVFGSSDTPNRAGNVEFDLHRLLIADSERNNAVAFIQISAGATAAAGVSAGDYTTLSYVTSTGATAESPAALIMGRIAVATKVWVRCMIIGQNTGTIDFYFGCHEYEG